MQAYRVGTTQHETPFCRVLYTVQNTRLGCGFHFCCHEDPPRYTGFPIVYHPVYWILTVHAKVWYKWRVVTRLGEHLQEWEYLRRVRTAASKLKTDVSSKYWSHFLERPAMKFNYTINYNYSYDYKFINLIGILSRFWDLPALYLNIDKETRHFKPHLKTSLWGPLSLRHIFRIIVHKSQYWKKSWMKSPVLEAQWWWQNWYLWQ